MAESTATAATFLFTDIEGSTQLLKRLRDEYGSVLGHHQRLLRDAFAAYGGQEVDTQGDAFFVAFRRARDAVLAAVAAQRALDNHDWPQDVELRVRIGIHTGEAAVAEDRYVGLSVHRAARICALGRGGQILISQTTRHVLEDDEVPLPGIELRDLGEHRLKDLARPVQLAEVVVLDWEQRRRPAPLSPQDARVVLPGALGLESPFPFVGRSDALAMLERLLPLGEHDRRRVALVSGEPGSGKTRLVRELAHRAAADGVLVLYGPCDAVVNAPYKPFVEALEFLTRVLEPDELRIALGTSGAELTRLLPDLVTRVGPLPAPTRADPDTERHRLHSAVADLLLQVSRRRPVLLIVDDAHWADAPTLHLFRHLSRAAELRVLLLATYRDREPDERPELADALADLSRLEGVTRHRLASLELAAVEDFLRRSVGVGQDVAVAATARSIEELTEGNPFLVCELWRTLVESGTVEVTERSVSLARPPTELASPESVREVVRYRLSRLRGDTTALLEIAAVLGTVIELRVLREASGMPDDAILAALEEAVRAGTIEEVPGSGLAHHFTHELVRRSLVDELTGVRRAELHLRVGEALETLHGAGTARVLPDLAHHFTLAEPVGGADRAVTYNLLAARAAQAALAFEDAAAYLTTAIDLGIEDDAERVRVELERGNAYLMAGKTPESLAAFGSAASLARTRPDIDALARAALGYEEASNTPMVSDERAVMLVREAIAALGEGDSALHARLLSALSRALVFVGLDEEASALRLEATAMAERVGDPGTLATVLIQEEIRNVRVPLEDMLGRLTQARDLAMELGDMHVLLEAMWRRISTLVGLGLLDEAREEVATFREVADRGREPVKLQTAELFGSALALCDGRLDEADEMAERAEEWTSVLRLPRSGEYGVQLFGIRREQGRLDELRPVVQLLATTPGGAAWGPGLAALLVELGAEDEARAELDRLRADQFREATGSLATAALVYLTDACVPLGDAESASLLYPRLEPLAARVVQIGQLVACYGAADRYLGMLAGVLGDWDVAEAHFEYGLYLNRRMGAHTWTAHTAYEYARVLINRGRAVDRPRAMELLSEASAACERFELLGLERKVAVLRGGRPTPVDIPDGLSAREVTVLRLVARGLSNREIGSELVISEHTAANHVRSILRKTGCANRTDAAAYAYRRGLVVES